MPLRQKLFAIAISVLICVVIVDLVRRRRLKEEYSLLWLVTGILLFILAMWYDLLKAITAFIGAVMTSSTLFFFGIIFLILINLHFSIRISELTDKVKNLVQELALVKAGLEKHTEQDHSSTTPD